MQRVLYLLLGAVMLPASLWAQARADAPTDTTVYAVSYVEVMPSSEGAAVAALRQYRDTSRKDEGYVRLEFFEQIGRPGHFAIVETWTDQKALDAHGAACYRTSRHRPRRDRRVLTPKSGAECRPMAVASRDPFDVA